MTGLPTPTIVIFDMDGTSVRHLNPYVLHTLEWLDNQARIISSVASWIFRRHGKGAPLEDWESYKKQKKPKLFVHRALHKLRRKEVDQIVEPCPDIYPVLDLLRSKRIPMALASNGLGKGYGHDILTKFDLEKYFTATVFREDIVRSKPSPEGILLAIERTDIELNKNDVIWYVGDRGKDVRAAIAADNHLPCKVVPIAYAIKAAIAIIENNLSPDHIIPSYADMHDKLKNMLSADESNEAPLAVRK